MRCFLIFLELRYILHFFIFVVLIVGFDREARACNKHVLVLGPGILEIEAAFTDHIKILS